MRSLSPPLPCPRSFATILTVNTLLWTTGRHHTCGPESCEVPSITSLATKQLARITHSCSALAPSTGPKALPLLIRGAWQQVAPGTEHPYAPSETAQRPGRLGRNKDQEIATNSCYPGTAPETANRTATPDNCSDPRHVSDREERSGPIFRTTAADTAASAQSPQVGSPSSWQRRDVNIPHQTGQMPSPPARQRLPARGAPGPTSPPIAPYQ